MFVFLYNVFVKVVAGVVVELLKKVTYFTVGKMQKKKNDGQSKDHRS